MPSHRVREEWMDEQVNTLEDLLRPGLGAVCVGINPSLTSVEAGHYYQGQLGQAFFARLRTAGVLARSKGGFEDDEAFAAGIGFTDIVKRPTRSAKDVAPAEFEHGRELLHDKLVEYAPKLVIFTYKKTAVSLFGKFDGNGFVPGLALAESRLFVMPGPYAKTELVVERMRDLRAALA